MADIFTNWVELISIAPQQKRLALVMILMQSDDLSYDDAVKYVSKLGDDGVRAEILEYQVHLMLTGQRKNERFL